MSDYSNEEIARMCLHEAIQVLRYVGPEAEDRLLPALSKSISGIHPRAAATAYRKAGKQISKESKKNLSIRANAFMSKTALNDLTEKGRGSPLHAHEITLLRAVFSYKRVITLRQYRAADIDYF